MPEVNSRLASSDLSRNTRSTGPCQVWCWDITYLRTTEAGSFFYLYLIEDVWSRKIISHVVEASENSQCAADLVQTAFTKHGEEQSIVLHSDNGAPMRSHTLLATLQRLGIAASFSRPRVSDDNAFCESLFRTLKARPTYPRGGRF